MKNSWFNIVLSVVVSFLLTSAGNFVAKAADPQGAIVWTVTEGCDAPESAYYDATSGFVFISNISGGGTDKDGKGWISKITPEGKVLAAKWVEGLDAPKGMRSHGGKLYVSDLTQVVVVDIAAAKIEKRIAIEGAKFLNDLATGPDGTVYVADMLTSTVHAINPSGTPRVFLSGDELESPNGLLVHDGKLYVAAWGRTTDFTTKTPGRLFSIDLKTKEKKLITREPAGNLDGLEVDGKGGFTLTDWAAGKLLHINADGKVTVLAQLNKGTADHAHLVDRKLLILPMMMDNKIVAYDLTKLGS